MQMCIMRGVGGSLNAVVMSEYLSCVFSLRRSAFSWATGPRLEIEGIVCVVSRCWEYSRFKEVYLSRA